MKSKLILPMMLLVLAFVTISCDDEDDTTQVTPETFTVTVSNVQEEAAYFQSGVFNTPVGDSEPGPATTGKSYSFTFNAGVGHRLTFATMFVQSNDLFYAPEDTGLALYDDSGNPVTGDITSSVLLWDAGTEVNEEPGTGENQAPRQSGPDTGTIENGTVSLIEDVNDGYTYPATNSVIRATMTNEGTQFTVTIENISGSSTLETPLAPGVFVVFSEGTPLFTKDQADFGDGLEGIAEDGNPADLGSIVEDETGLVTPLAPGPFAIHAAGVNALFTNGTPDAGDGMEAVAEDGDPSAIGGALSTNPEIISSGVFNTPEGAAGPGPLFPGSSYSFTFSAVPGDYLSFATMFVQSNDLFYAFDEAGIALYDANGNAVSGDVTSSILLWDAGTEVNEFPGAGNNQAPRQGGADIGEVENGNVRVVDDGFEYPSNESVIQVTITVN